MKLNKQIISDLRKEYGDAFYLLDSKQFRSNYTELKNAFSSIYSNFNIAYSYKTNYTPRLCKIVNELGGYAEVVSEMEAALAMRIGVKENRIIWNGPIKNKEKLESILTVPPANKKDFENNKDELSNCVEKIVKQMEA